MNGSHSSGDLLLGAVTSLTHALHRDRVELLCEVLKGPSLGSLSEWKLCLPPRGRAESILTNLYQTAVGCDVKPEFLRGLLLGASHAFAYAGANEQIDFVWTGPSTSVVPFRRTEQVLIELLRSARESFFLTSFVAYRVSSIIAEINKCLDRGVRVSILLEEYGREGGGLNFDSITLLKSQVPGADFYSWNPRDEEFLGGKVHAKIAVADRKQCFVSSANLTGHAMERNIEAGLLVKGGAVPDQLSRHLEALVYEGIAQKC